MILTLIVRSTTEGVASIVDEKIPLGDTISDMLFIRGLADVVTLKVGTAIEPEGEIDELIVWHALDDEDIEKLTFEVKVPIPFDAVRVCVFNGDDEIESVLLNVGNGVNVIVEIEDTVFKSL